MSKNTKCVKKTMSKSNKKDLIKSTSSKRSITFEYNTAPGQNVAVTGSFNNWEAKPMLDKNNDGNYRCRLMLAPGEYQYKFMVNGQWHTDVNNPNFVPNEFGTLNSLLVVEEK